MILFLLAAAALLAYGLVYVRFTIKKGGIAGAVLPHPHLKDHSKSSGMYLRASRM